MIERISGAILGTIACVTMFIFLALFALPRVREWDRWVREMYAEVFKNPFD
jgi:hypothetical protein